MNRRILGALALIACLSPACFAQGPAAIKCVQDLESLPAFLMENDTGAPVHMAQFGRKYFDDALAEARTAALEIRGNASCLPVMSKYLQAWRRGHLSVEALAPVPAAATVDSPPAKRVENERPDNSPTLYVLSTKTIRLTLRSFEPQHRDALIALIKAHRGDLAGHPNWIIDVRSNGGGSDSSYAPLIPWLMPDETADAGVEILATPANVAGWERACAIFAPGDAACEKSLADSLAKMRKAVPGTYVATDDSDSISYDRAEGIEPHRPVRVAILIDRGCGSSCEQFALAARQSFSVKLIGQHTYGSLDYSNLRPYDLPSGLRRLWYATTRSSRIPGLMVDVAGVQPDIYLPLESGTNAYEDEVRRVQSWLEGGSLAPQAAK